jgi:hypothetical protein
MVHIYDISTSETSSRRADLRMVGNWCEKYLVLE